MALEFTHESHPQRVVFARGRAAEHTAAEIDRLGAHRVMLIMGEGRASAGTDQLVAALPVVERWTEVVQHVPEDLAARAVELAVCSDIDALVCVGGGSATGLAKGVALSTGLPIIAVPTTYSGSEATDMWGLTAEATKRTGVDRRVLPVSVVYDSNLSERLPLALSIASGFNALAHCVDSLWAPRADPINKVVALEGARALAAAMRGLAVDARDADARDRALYGCYLAGTAFASAGSGLHHKICHVLGGTFGLPHAETHTIMLPHVARLNLPGVPELETRLAATLSPAEGAGATSSAAAALQNLADEVGAPHRLADYGFADADVDEAARRIMPVIPDSNPVAVSHDALIQLLNDARVGTRHPHAS